MSVWRAFIGFRQRYDTYISYLRCIRHPFAGNNRKITETQNIVQQTRSVRPRTGTWEKGEGFNILPLKEKEPVQVSGRIILNLRLGPSHKAGNISQIQICSATLDSHRRRTPPRPQGWLRFMLQVLSGMLKIHMYRPASGMIPVPNRKLTLMCRAIGADTTQARGLSSKWKAF